MPKLSRAIHDMLASGSINRREANHLQAEADKPVTMIKIKGRGAQTQAARGRRQVIASTRRAAGQKEVTSGRRQRNNRREY